MTHRAVKAKASLRMTQRQFERCCDAIAESPDNGERIGATSLLYQDFELEKTGSAVQLRFWYASYGPDQHEVYIIDVEVASPLPSAHPSQRWIELAIKLVELLKTVFGG
jgi:hypothetical protein